MMKNLSSVSRSLSQRPTQPLSLLLAAGLALSAAGCVYPARTVYYGPPPPPHAEVVGVAPGPGYVWIHGRWAWRGGNYVWVVGHWTARPGYASVWVDGRWENRGGNYVFVDGYWR